MAYSTVIHLAKTKHSQAILNLNVNQSLTLKTACFKYYLLPKEKENTAQISKSDLTELVNRYLHP